MATFNKFFSFTEALAKKVHNLTTDQLVVALTNSSNPPLTANSRVADLTVVSYTNLTSRNVATSTGVQTSGIYKLVLNDLVLSASGTVAAFRYIVLYNSTAANSELIGWYDYGSDLTLANTETLTIDFDQAGGALTIT